MQRQTLKKFAVPATLVALLFLVSGCLDILQIIQPSSVLPGATFEATIEVALDETGCGCPGGGPSAGLVALLIPTDFTVNSIDAKSLRDFEIDKSSLNGHHLSSKSFIDFK